MRRDVNHSLVGRQIDPLGEASLLPAAFLPAPVARHGLPGGREPGPATVRPPLLLLIATRRDELQILGVAHRYRSNGEIIQALRMRPLFVVEDKALAGCRTTHQKVAAGQFDVACRRQVCQPLRGRPGHGLSRVVEGLGVHVFMEQGKPVKVEGGISVRQFG